MRVLPALAAIVSTAYAAEQTTDGLVQVSCRPAVRRSALR